jgi:putative hemolysin
MPDFLTGFIAVFLLIVLNGVLSMSEMAVVSARRPRLHQMAEDGQDGARAALKLSEDPGDFLSTIQIGITLIGILTGAFSGATLSQPVAELLSQFPPLEAYAEPLAVGLMVVLTTYLSLIVGELVPKRIALNNAERIAAMIAGPMNQLSRLGTPLVWLLDKSSEMLLRLMGIRRNGEPQVTEEEVRVLIEQGTQSGVFEPIEEEIMDQVFRLSDRTVSAIMTPRTDIVWFDVEDPDEVVREIVLEHGHSRYPVARDDLDDMVGLVMVKDMLAKRIAGEPIELEALAQPPLFVPESMPALDVIERLRETRSHLALVIDEYGGLEGLVTFTDIMRAILGELPDNTGQSESPVVQREDGSWLVDGMYAVDELKDTFDLKELPDEEDASYQTLGGMIMAMLGRVPTVGNRVDWGGYRLEVVDMDGRRIDKVLISRLPDA